MRAVQNHRLTWPMTMTACDKKAHDPAMPDPPIQGDIASSRQDLWRYETAKCLPGRYQRSGLQDGHNSRGSLSVEYVSFR